MALVYITGVSGSGKSSIRNALRTLGYETYDVDETDISIITELKTGNLVEMAPANLRENDWFRRHSWTILPSAINRLKDLSDNKLVFLCGAAKNDKNYWDIFDLVICLDINEKELRRRIANRKDNDYGKNSLELQEILNWHGVATENYRALGAHVIDAERPINEVTIMILNLVENINTKGMIKNKIIDKT